MIEPYRIKIVEPLIRAPRPVRRQAAVKAGYNTFLVPARYVTIDLISDSGTGAMSAGQWAAMIAAREDFSGSAAAETFAATARELTGFKYIQPVHQGRTAENILFRILVPPGSMTLANGHFETTRANINAVGAQAVDLPREEPPYAGNIDVDRARDTIRRHRRVSLIIMTLTSNANGGQPASLENLNAISALARRHRIPLVIDGSRFCDNAALIQERLRPKRTIKQICRAMFARCDILYLSSKKDGLVNIGGFIGTNDRRTYRRLHEEIIRQESYPASGGLAGRDLAAMAAGMRESMDEEFLKSHFAGLRRLARHLKNLGVKFYEPVGGHGLAIYPERRFPFAAHSLAALTFIESGIRGGVFADQFRLAIPRRVYTENQLRHAADAVGRIYCRPLPRLKPVNRPRAFFNFFVKFRKI